MPQLYSHGGSLLSAPSGVLLYGPPGCGKTMLAKALAHESGASFINLHISTLLEKWYGDSNKLVRAVFTLARKMQPAIIFIDEIDAVLRMRANSDHEASAMVKAEYVRVLAPHPPFLASNGRHRFMTLWDGLASANTSGMPARIVVLGATNRMQDIDEAILRRMPKKFAVHLPVADQRRRILQLILSDTKLDPEGLDLDYVVKITAGMSGSDLKEACRDAAMAPVREFIRQNRGGVHPSKPINPDHIRGIRTEDFLGKLGGQALTDLNKRRNDASTAEADVASSVDYLDAEAESLG
jgi:SpoVK/Ycf46/Vps4 family AAA+-type ATPase